MTRKYRTIKFSKDVGTISRKEALTAVRELNEGKLHHGDGRVDTGQLATVKKNVVFSGYGLKKG